MTDSPRPSDSGIIARAVRLVRPEWYVRSNTDLGLDGGDARIHFEAFGLREGRSPRVLFDPQFYRHHVGDLGDPRTPIEHYLAAGQR